VLRELSLAEREIVLDPLFSSRKLTERQLIFLKALCADIGLISLWQTRVANGHGAAPNASVDNVDRRPNDRAAVRHLLRAKSIRNLGKLRHQPSWQLLMMTVGDRHRDIQGVALRSLAAVGAPESFPALRQQLHEAIEGAAWAPPLPELQAAMASFNLRCAPDLAPTLRHPNHRLRLHATQILRMMVFHEAAIRPQLTLTPELLTPCLVELLLTELVADRCAEVRARAAEVIVFLTDKRVTSALHNSLFDHQWFVRMRTVRALAQSRQAAAPLFLEIRDCLRDPHWRVREAAIQTLVSLGLEGKNQLFEHFLTSADTATREQIVEVIERTGLMSALVEEYSIGANGLEALIVERLASEAAPLGVSGVLRTLNPQVRRKFLERFLPYAEARMGYLKKVPPNAGSAVSPQQALPFPPSLAA
jgi:HEAT repeat protein